MSCKFVRLTAIVCVLFGSLFYGISCRNDPALPKEKLESIAFDKERVIIKVDEEATVRVIAKSDTAKKNEKIKYMSTNEGVVEITEMTNDGFIVKGLRGGSTVIMAKSELVTSYLEMIVESESVLLQYITVAQPVIEMMEGERRSTQVSLYGGNMLDNNDFVWQLENGKDNIGISVTANIAVISGLQGGHQKIIVSHPKAEFESEILVFVKHNEEAIKYITSESNVFLVPNDGQYHNFSVNLANGLPEDVINFVYEVTENSGFIELVSNGNVCNVKGIRSGASIIQITHPDAVMEFQVRVITYDPSIPYIALDKTFSLLNVGESVNIVATVENSGNAVQALNEFSYELITSNNNVVEVIQTNNSFYVRAKQGGNARIIISNEQTETSREVLVVVRDEIVYRDDYYITTSQNVIMTEVGAVQVILNIQLVNGNSADANSFEWVVDDGTLITVESGHGIVRGNRAAITSVFNAVAVITPKAVGTAKITISHPKSETITTVMVKVYPRGTFAVPPILVGIDGLLKVISGTPLTVQLHMVSGDILDVGDLNWSTVDTGIATVNTNARGMVNVLNGVSNGLTKMVVSGANLEYPHESLVLAGTPEFVNNASVIYVDEIYQKILEEQTISIEVKDSQGIYVNSDDFKAVVEDKNVLYVVMVKNKLMLQGKEAGETKVLITHPNAINDITVNVQVCPKHINIEKPYHITGPEMIGLVRGMPGNVEVTLAGAGESEFGGLSWEVEDTSIVNIIANGKEGIFTGRVSNRQTKVRVKHPKSDNEKVILAYVVENEADLYNKVVIGLNTEHYLMAAGDERLITLITNASDSQKLGLSWNIKYGDEYVAIDSNYDSAMVRAIAAGNAEIVVTHPDNIIPANIYISVVDALSAEKKIKGPAVVELIAGESRIVSAQHINLTQVDINNIRWSVEDGTVASIQESGDSAYLLGLKKGVSYVNIRQNDLKYQHRATLVCANMPEELASMYILGVGEAYHSMLLGEEKKIRLEYGSMGFPEEAKSRIKWEASGNRVVRVAGSGESVTVIAEGEGSGTVTVSCEGVSFNTLELTFVVQGNKANVLEFRNYDKIVGLVVGNTKQVVMRVYDGNDEITTGYSLLKFDNSNHDVMGMTTVDNIIDIKAKAAGQGYITVNREGVNDAARILVYTANTQEELDLYYPVAANKTNYLLQVGESATVKINTIDNDAAKLANIQWGIENSNIIETPTFNGKKEVIIKGRSEGQCILNVSYSGAVVERIYVTVVENNTIDMTKFIVTESIIGLVRGESRTTTVHGNLSGGEMNTVIWGSSDPNVVTVVGSGSTATITARSNGEAYVTVTYGSWLKRHILVYVCDTEIQVKNYRAMNMENQYIRVGKNENVILPLYYGPNKPSVPTMWVDKYDNKVVRFTALEDGGKLSIDTLNEGVAVLEATNTGLSNPGGVLRIYIEVSNRYNGAPPAPELKYLTAVKTIYLLNPDKPEETITVGVNGIGMTAEELSRVQWQVVDGGQYVNIAPAGRECVVRVSAAALEGTATLQAYSFVDNPVLIKVVVSRTGLVGFPHIVGDDVVYVSENETIIVEYDVAEIAQYDKNLFSMRVIGTGATYADVKMVGSMLEVTGKRTGQVSVEITCGNVANPVCQFSRQVMVLVTTTPNGLVYLTTQNNFSVVKSGEYKNLSVEMVGYDDAGEQGYIWSVDSSTPNIVSLSGSGRQAQVQGLASGVGKTAKINVRNDSFAKNYPIVLYVRVTELVDPLYITTDKNIVSVVEGRSVTLQADIVNGNPSMNNLFQWTTATPALLEVKGAGNSAVVVGKQVGIGYVTIGHSNTDVINRNMQVLVIVERDTSNSDLYLTTASTLVEVKPGENRSITVRLVGGDNNDNYNYTWKLLSYNSVVKINNTVNQQVLETYFANTDTVSVRGMNEGEAIIRVTHSKTSYILDIKVLVSTYSQLRFRERSVNVDQGRTVTVSMEVPAGESVVYKTNNDRVATVSGTNSACIIEGKSPGTAIISAVNARGTMSDEIIVNVREINNRSVGYIQTPNIIYTMSDWQSSMNRLIISGNLVGSDDNNVPFDENDNTTLQWKVSGGSDIVDIDYKGTNGVYTGKTVNVYSKKPGMAELTVSNSNRLSSYEKKLYIYVTSHNSNFRVTPEFLNMQIGDMGRTIEAIGSDVENWNDVLWKIEPTEYGDYCVSFVDNDGNNLGGAITPSGKSVRLKALAAQGNHCQVFATYNNTTTLPINIWVEPEKSLEIGENYMLVLPNEVKKIPINVIPAAADVKINVNTTMYLKEHEGVQTPYIEGTGSERFLVICGGDNEGVTQIKLTSNYIERIVSVNTDYNFAFYLVGVEKQNSTKTGWSGNIEPMQVVRGQPGENVRVWFNVFPENDIVSYEESEIYEDKIVKRVEIGGPRGVAGDPLRSIIITLAGAGKQDLVFVSDYNSKIDLSMTVPVYVYYENIPVTWGYENRKLQSGVNVNDWKTATDTNYPVFSDNNKRYSLYSQLDQSKTAIFIADFEEMKIFLTPGRNSGTLNGNYGGHGMSVLGDPDTRFVSIVGDIRGNIELAFDDDDNGFIIKGNTNGTAQTGKVVGLMRTDYVGAIDVAYEYWNGGETKAKFKKTFLLYREQYAR